MLDSKLLNIRCTNGCLLPVDESGTEDTCVEVIVVLITSVLPSSSQKPAGCSSSANPATPEAAVAARYLLPLLLVSSTPMVVECAFFLVMVVELGDLLLATVRLVVCGGVLVFKAHRGATDVRGTAQ